MERARQGSLHDHRSPPYRSVVIAVVMWLDCNSSYRFPRLGNHPRLAGRFKLGCSSRKPLVEAGLVPLI